MPLDLAIPAQLSLALLPDLVLMVGAMVLLLAAVWGEETLERARAVGMAAVVVCVLTALAIVWMMRQGAHADRTGIIAVDGFRWVTDLVILIATVFTILMMIDYSRREDVVTAEAHVLVLLAAAGMMLLAAARDLIIVFLGIELMSIGVYILAGLNRRSARAAEAALKYFLLGAFSTGFLLYGIALVYGGTGSTNLAAIGEHVAAGDWQQMPMLLAGIGLLVVGFGFKVAAAPFHMYTPDVYEGAPTPFTAFMAAAVKAAAFAAFLRVWIEAFPSATYAWHAALWWLAVITMVVGNVIALLQKNIKRMLAYSSIAHAGYLLVTIVVVGPERALGATAFLFYILAYTLATVGAFAVVVALDQRGERNQTFGDFAGLWTVRPWLAVAMAIFMLALLGFPVFGGMGFFAKWYVLQAALAGQNPQTHLAVVLVVTSVISAGYYLGLVMWMFMRPRAAEAPALPRTPAATGIVIAAAAAALLLFGVWPTPALDLARHGEQTWQAPAGPPLSAAPRAH